jgi:PEGA domain
MKLVAHGVGLLCALSLSWPAWAEPSEADRATARALAFEGHEALTKKDYATAADRFGRADALVHAPTLVVDWARALQGLGRFVEAHEKYELVLREGVTPSAPKSWVRALDEAKKELDALKPRLGWVTVVLVEPPEATVKIDGVPIPPAAIGVKRAADPGFPEVVVSAPGYEPFTQVMTVGPGEEKSLEVSLRKLPESPKPTRMGSDEAPTSHEPDTRRVLTYVAFGVGGAGLVAGGITGALFLRKRADLNDECLDARVCPSTSKNKIDTYESFGTASGVSLAVGVAGLGAGLVLWLTEPQKTQQASATWTMRPLLGLGVIGAEGSFQ